MPETGQLTLDSARAAASLGWHGTWDWKAALSRTLQWYAAVASGADPGTVTRSQISEYATGAERG